MAGSKIHRPNEPAPSSRAPTIPIAAVEAGMKLAEVAKRRSLRELAPRDSPPLETFFRGLLVFWDIGGRRLHEVGESRILEYAARR